MIKTSNMSSMRLLITAVLLLIFTTLSAKEPVLETLIITTADGTAVEYKIEIARTERQMQRGLMFRDTLPENQGMLFVYKPERKARMWMKNTILSLDMVFINSDGEIINIAENTTPFSLDTIDSGGPVRGVLELNAGQALKHKFALGDKVTHPMINSR